VKNITQHHQGTSKPTWIRKKYQLINLTTQKRMKYFLLSKNSAETGNITFCVSTNPAAQWVVTDMTC